jgi:hypothetical protein
MLRFYSFAILGPRVLLAYFRNTAMLLAHSLNTKSATLFNAKS